VQLRITVSAGPDVALVRIDGWLGGDGVAALEQTLASVRGPMRLLVHDLRGADAAGVSLLHRLDREGAALDGLSPYLRLTIARSPNPLTAPALSVTHAETPVRSDNT